MVTNGPSHGCASHGSASPVTRVPAPVQDLAVLLPVARFTALAWLVTVGFRLPPARPRTEVAPA